MKRALFLLAAAVALAACNMPAKAEFPEAFWNPDEGRYFLPQQKYHLKHPNRVLDLQRLKEQQRQQREWRLAREREAERLADIEWRERNGPRVAGALYRVPYTGVFTLRDGCQPLETVIGNDSHSEAQAKRTARAQWMDNIQYKYGQQFMDPRFARNETWTCSQSSVDAVTIIGRTKEALQEVVPGKIGGWVKCRFAAQACVAPSKQDVQPD